MEYVEKRILELDQYEYGILLQSLVEMRNGLEKDQRTCDEVDDVLLKVINAPERRMRSRHREGR